MQYLQHTAQTQSSHVLKRPVSSLQAQSMQPLPSVASHSNQHALSSHVQAPIASDRQVPELPGIPMLHPTQSFNNKHPGEPKTVTITDNVGHTQPYDQPSHAPALPPAASMQPRREMMAWDDHEAPATEARSSHEPAQFMSALSSLYGNTTPEQKRMREDKQKQYARELDEQVDTTAALHNSGPCKSNIIAFPSMMLALVAVCCDSESMSTEVAKRCCMIGSPYTIVTWQQQQEWQSV